MNQYFATFPPGTYELISKHLKAFAIAELKIIEHDDSSVVFQSSLGTDRLIEIRYFTNIYLEIDNNTAFIKSALKGKYFRLMMLKNGAPHPIDSVERADIEAQIKSDFRLETNTHLSKNDFYVIERQSGRKLFTIRLSRVKFKRETLSAGELRPELAHILCLTAGIKAKFTVLDMFAGYGSIPYEAVRGFGCKSVISVDIKTLPNRHTHSLIKWYEADARNLAFLDDNSIDRVVTDPPWGLYDGSASLSSLYTDFVAELRRVLKPDGVVVIICGGEMAGYFEKLASFKLIGKWNVLVSGKKATIFKLQKGRDK